MNLFFILSFYFYSISHLIFGFEYSPYDVLTMENFPHTFVCGQPHKDSKVMWFSSSCDFKSINYISMSDKLVLTNFDHECFYYQCIILENSEIVYENMFKIVNLENPKLFSSFFRFDNQMYVINSIFFSTQLKKTEGFKLEWFIFRNERLFIVNNSKYISIYDNKIKISMFLPHENIGFIPCLVNEELGRKSVCGHSYFIRSSDLSKGQKILYTNLNDYVVLRCVDINGNTDIQWFKDGNEIQFDNRIVNNIFFITISDFMTSDSGYYQCISREPSQLPYLLSIFLVAFNSSDFNYSVLAPVKKMEMSSFVLPCNNSRKEETPKFMFWTFNVLNRLSFASDFTNAIVNFDMYIYDAIASDSGLYQCRVSYPNRLKIFSFFVHIQSNEDTINNGIHNLKKRSVDEVGEITNLKFKASSNNINLSWSPPFASVKRYIIKWGKMYPGPQKQNIDGKETKFTIPSLRPETTYFIDIVAETVNGPTKPILTPIATKEENKEILLTIPVNLKLINVGNNWSKISWESRNNENMNENIPDKIYQVRYCPIRSQRGQKSYKNTTEATLKIDDVKPATTYEFDVRTCLLNSSKCSDWSMAHEFTTLGTKPGDSPQHLTLSTIQVTNGPSDNTKSNHMFAVQVSWQPPKEPNGEIKNYLIFLTADKRLDISSWGERTVSGKTLNTVIDRLDLNRYYYFRILCSNEYGKSPLSPIRIFKTPDENGKNVGPVYLSKDYYDPMEISEELKLSRSIERGTDDFPDVNNNGKKSSKNDKFGFAGYKWWIIIGIIVGAALIFILIILFLVAIKCRNENSNLDFHSKVSKKNPKCNMKYGLDTNEKVKFVNKGPILTTPDLFRHTKDQNCHSNYLDLEERNESPNSFSSNKAFPGLNHNQPFSSQNNYRNIPGHYTPPGLIHQQNIVMTTSQLTSNSNERHFYQVPFLHHVGHNSFNVFANSAPRVNAAASDFNSINVPSPISDFSDFTSSQATVLYDTSTAKSSGGKSSLSGSGSYNNGLGNKSSLTTEPILEAYSSDKNADLKYTESVNNGNSVSKAFSSEELSQEMANLEGLMKDLNNITQKEFEC